MLLFPVVILSVAGETDREFMKALFIRHRITMFRVARTLTKSDPDAEDVVSEACVLLIGKISRLRQLDCNVLEGYVISTVKNAAYLLHRRKKGAQGGSKRGGAPIPCGREHRAGQAHATEMHHSGADGGRWAAIRGRSVGFAHEVFRKVLGFGDCEGAGHSECVGALQTDESAAENLYVVGR